MTRKRKIRASSAASESALSGQPTSQRSALVATNLDMLYTLYIYKYIYIYTDNAIDLSSYRIYRIYLIYLIYESYLIYLI